MERYRGYLTLTLIYLLLLAGAVFYLRRPQPEPLAIISPTPLPAARAIIVHVSGAVARPGVYTLSEEARVIEALEAAGGAQEADLERINLAKRLRDEEHIRVPRVGEEVPLVLERAFSGSQAGGKVNINTAGIEELVALPGIGSVYAKRIVEYRERHGPFKTVEEIKEVEGIGEATFAKVKDWIVVK